MKRVLRPCLAIFIAFVSILALSWGFGDNPFTVGRTLLTSGFQSWYAFGMTVVYTIPLVLTGLSVAVAYQAGLFNIGAEGQLTVGAIAAATAGVACSGLPNTLAIPIAFFATIIAGALWGGVAGWIRAVRGGHEVISTIMLNFVAASLAVWFVVDMLPNREVQSPESLPIAPDFALTHIERFDGAAVSTITGAIPILALACSFFLFKTAPGFRLRLSGSNPRAALFAGVHTQRWQISSMLLAGALAGSVGFVEVFVNSGTLKLGFSPGYGFMGIAVAFLARCRPIGVLFSAYLIAYLHKGTLDLEFETDFITKDVSSILQAIIILLVAAEGLWERFHLAKRTEENVHG